MDDRLKVELEDAELLSEVELTTNLMIAATAADKRLSDAEIDKILGVAPEEPTPQQAAS